MNFVEAVKSMMEGNIVYNSERYTRGLMLIGSFICWEDGNMFMIEYKDVISEDWTLEEPNQQNYGSDGSGGW